jgi:hypothetical protein
MIDEVFNTPSVSEIVDIIGSENKYYCSIDLRQWYCYLPLRVCDREKTSLRAGGLSGKQQYCVSLYGLKDGGKVFQHAMKKVLEGLIEKHGLVYADGVQILGKTFDHRSEG